MKFAYTKLLFLVALLIVSGCSGEEPDNYKMKNVVRKAIQKPAGETKDLEETKKEIADIVDKDIGKRINQETIKKQSFPQQDDTIYITKEGDTLSDISGKVYNDPLKWPFLYRDNPEVLSSIKDRGNLNDEVLTPGIRLKITSPAEIETNLEDRPRNYFTVNVISSPYMKEITPQVVKLLDEGYYAYISNAMVDGKKWYRLRTGFYNTRSEANREGDEIKTHIHIPDIWAAKIGDEEFSEFGGY